MLILTFRVRTGGIQKKSNKNEPVFEAKINDAPSFKHTMIVVFKTKMTHFRSA